MLETVQIVCLSLVNNTTKLYLNVGAISPHSGKHFLAILSAIFLAYFGKLAR
jgi:hypothetical protein